MQNETHCKIKFEVLGLSLFATHLQVLMSTIAYEIFEISARMTG